MLISARSRRSAGLLAGAVAVISVSLLNPSAGAATIDRTQADSATSVQAASLSPGLRVAGQSIADALAAYWTPERMRAADPADAPPTTTLPPSGQPAPASGLDVAQPVGVAGAEERLDVASSHAVGKVFFTDPDEGVDKVCSAGALNSSTKRLVITAGHCVHGGEDGEFMDNWVFVPHYDDGNRPHGTFPARTYRTFNAWTEESSFQHDVAMVTTDRNEFGDLLVNEVGGLGLSVNFSKQQFLTGLAYPAAGPIFDGQTQMFCTGTSRSVSDGRIELNCGFTGGASGGPWMRNYSDSTKLGSVNGVFSTLASTGWNRSPYFDTKVKTMWENSVND